MLKRMKKDALWKPLIRLFRRYLKKDALPQKVYNEVRLEPLAKQGYLFCQHLKIPEEFLTDEQTSIAMMLMINSHRITKNR